MKKIKTLILEVQKNGIPQYEKQVIEISNDGYIIHYLYPMVYLGSMKKYEFTVEKVEIEKFFKSFDFENWDEVAPRSFECFSFNLKIQYEDNNVFTKAGYINLEMPKEYELFDEKLLDLVMFIEKPWLFTK